MQEHLASLAAQGDAADTLIILEHPSTYTVGKRGTFADFKKSEEELSRLGAGIEHINRGGETTFHGPGQVVLYPIINLRRLKCGARAYVEGLEDSLIATLSTYGVQARGRVRCRTGVWVEDRKIAAIGVQISHGVTRHGAALNVTTDLSYFSHIVPCGIADKEMTTLQKELGVPHVSTAEVASRFTTAFAEQFGYHDSVEISREKLEEQAM
ncbi:LIPOYLtransferase 2 [Coccomyxa subellipsoidea C-169]|uniref:lipoyl(octanoyl) transferase n=1 Tax=Coccomyxa subellipsoidea (strain C-169) TaxID=574566 RepID=I0Z9B4_COCSC|nr:LIPOYLtransferase 2 [Coccomyxa subellipsoidea C-169]EIE27233.1 LIPOYLtransferase 2 [Coccomyxa subellipsoidea C-169]|eukprot:XP_005651777.1 LIPOYLtransferase 2 [Coccomyxa subellipsoidea C-169]